jgi:tRNA(Arg) A34 adenosine deaminase TadA
MTLDARGILLGSAPTNPRRACFELAWEALQDGSVPVDAVVVDRDGHIITRGRSRDGETDGPEGQLRGTCSAYAEVNALTGWPPASYPDHTLYTSLQPCLLETGAAPVNGAALLPYAALNQGVRSARRPPCHRGARGAGCT